jgi:uncharacterized protein YukE
MVSTADSTTLGMNFESNLQAAASINTGSRAIAAGLDHITGESAPHRANWTGDAQLQWDTVMTRLKTDLNDHSLWVAQHAKTTEQVTQDTQGTERNIANSFHGA